MWPRKRSVRKTFKFKTQKTINLPYLGDNYGHVEDLACDEAVEISVILVMEVFVECLDEVVTFGLGILHYLASYILKART